MKTLDQQNVDLLEINISLILAFAFVQIKRFYKTESFEFVPETSMKLKQETGFFDNNHVILFQGRVNI